LAIKQSINKYVYAINNPLLYSDCSGEFVITTALICLCVGAAVGATIGGVVGANTAKSKGYSKKDGLDYWKHIIGGAVIGGVIGGALGYFAAPMVATATGISGISITGTGIVILPLNYSGQIHHVLSNPIMKSLNSHPTLSGLFDRAGSIVQAMYKYSHYGYEKWHRAIDNYMATWLSNNQNASANDFWCELYKLYNTHEMIQRFGESVLNYILNQIKNGG